MMVSNRVLRVPQPAVENGPSASGADLLRTTERDGKPDTAMQSYKPCRIRLFRNPAVTVSGEEIRSDHWRGEAAQDQRFFDFIATPENHNWLMGDVVKVRGYDRGPFGNDRAAAR